MIVPPQAGIYERDIMGYEFFTTKYSRSGLPTVTLTKGGYFTFNAIAIQGFGITDFSFVRFGYDKENKKVAFQFLSEAEYSTAKITFNKGKPATVCARAFTKFYKINHEHNKAFPLEREGDLIVFQLEE